MSEQDRAIGLYAFLKEFARLRTRPVRDIDAYKGDGSVIWAGDIPREPGCDCIAWRRDGAEESDTWMEVRRPRLTPPPEPPDSVREWLQEGTIEDSSRDLPELLPDIPANDPDEPPLRLENHPEVQAVYDEWVRGYWQPWAEQNRRDQAVQQVYADLFAVYQRQQSLGEMYEVVFGLGFLSWRPPGGQPVRRHLITAQVDMALDSDSGTLTVNPVADGATPAFEYDMLDPAHLPDANALQRMQDDLEKIGDALWDHGPLDALLRSWAHEASPTGQYDDTLAAHKGAGGDPVVHLAPALIMRRGREHSFVRAFEQIGMLLKNGAQTPESVARFINPPPNSAPAPAGDGSGASTYPPDELYFPLSANDEQRQIVERLTYDRGVLVQGPPGTGKSHTIVNLISHALATGQRVLATSHAARALEVLRNKIRNEVAEIAPLAVVLPGNSQDAIREMERSVQGILNRRDRQMPLMSQRDRGQLTKELDAARRQEAQTLAGLRAIREQETYRHYGKFGYGGTLARISEMLRSERESLDWIPDGIPQGAEPPLTACEFTELTTLLRDQRLTRWEDHGWVSVETTGLPTADEFEKAVAEERQARAAHDAVDAFRKQGEYHALRKTQLRDRVDIGATLTELDRMSDHIEQYQMAWISGAARDIIVGMDRPWWLLYQDSLEFARRTSDAVKWLDAHSITPSPSSLEALREDARALLGHFEKGGGWGFDPFRASVVKRSLYVRGLRIGGRPCETAEELRELVRRLDADIEVSRLHERWAKHYQFVSTTFTDLIAEIEDLCAPIKHAFDARKVRQQLMQIATRAALPSNPGWWSPEVRRRWREALAAVDAVERFEAANERIEAWVASLVKQQRNMNIDPAAYDMNDALVGRDTAAYATLRESALNNCKTDERLRQRQTLLGCLEGAAPKLHLALNGLKQTPGHPTWKEIDGDFERAWNWKRAHAWAKHMASPGKERALLADIDRAKQEIVRALERLAAEEAWNYCFSRMSEQQRMSLIAWRQAIIRAGKSTGKYAAKHRRDARKHLEECRSAIPAWVMPLHRVAETFEPEPEPLFDLAIIDEASQSGPEALLLAWLAKRIVVVGDDEQISPSDVGMNVGNVNQIRAQHLASIPFNNAFGAQGGSFFQLAEVFFGNRIRLREHFRCMPEIIQFSNNLSYENQPLIPLRQYGAERLDPVVEARHVPDGYQRGTAGNAVNPPEVEAIVAEIVRMCGDAYAFQGDERDIMLLSLVSSPSDGHSIVRPLTGRGDKQRFNVAASRARDQMLLFHTAMLNDLSANPDCVRRKLLEYCLNPEVPLSGAKGLDLPELERIAARTQRERGNQPPPFDSWFELDVFLRIVRRGYRVIPQHEVHGYRIDLVVQGMQGSLAVECDGDEWHGAEEYEADVARQRDLERCGWTFWRVRESEFRLDPDAALEDLWETLKRRSITPIRESR